MGFARNKSASCCTTFKTRRKAAHRSHPKRYSRQFWQTSVYFYLVTARLYFRARARRVFSSKLSALVANGTGVTVPFIVDGSTSRLFHHAPYPGFRVGDIDCLRRLKWIRRIFFAQLHASIRRNWADPNNPCRLGPARHCHALCPWTITTS